MDFFDILPDHLLLSIFSFLPLTDAARTSILSRRWADQWAHHRAHMTDFDLDLDLLFPQNPLKQAEFIKAVISSPHLTIRKIQISLPYGPPTESPNPAQWAYELVEKGVNELSLINRGYAYPVTKSLLTSKSLTVLKLQYCYFVDYTTSIDSCTNLRSLELDSVWISDEILCELLSTCKQLEFLSLMFCGTYVVHSESLVQLRLVLPISSRRYIEVSAPNLEGLELDFGPDLYGASVDVPKVRKCRVKIKRMKKICNESLLQVLYEIVTRIGSSEFLQLEGAMLQCLSLCISSWESAISFKALKKLCLTLSTNDKLQICAVNALLRSCPQLQELRFDIKHTYRQVDTSDMEASIYQEPFCCPSPHLDQVELIGFRGFEYEMNILKFILENGRAVDSKPEEQLLAEKDETECLCKVMAFLDKHARVLVIDKGDRTISFKLGEWRVRLEIPLDAHNLKSLFASH